MMASNLFKESRNMPVNMSDYTPPAIEKEMTSEDVEREVHYAGAVSGDEV